MSTATTKYVYSPATYTHRISFYANGGGTVPSQVQKSKSSSGSTCTVATSIPSTIPTRSGYSFLGYSKSANGSVSYRPGGSVSHTFTRSATYNYTTTTMVDDGVVYTKYYTSSDQSYRTELYAIWEATGSTVSTTDGTLGVQQTLTITPLDPSYTHTLRFDFAGQTGTIASNVATSATWTIASQANSNDVHKC